MTQVDHKLRSAAVNQLLAANKDGWDLTPIANYIAALEARQESAPVPQNELLEAAKRLRRAQKACQQDDTWKTKLMVRACEDVLDLAIRNAEQAQGTPTP